VFQVLVLVAGLKNVIEQLDQSTRKEVQLSSGNGSSVNKADFSALVEIKGTFQKEYHQKSSKYSEFFTTNPKTQRMEAHKISLETELYCGLEKFTKDLWNSWKHLNNFFNYLPDFFDRTKLALGHPRMESGICCKNLSSNGAPSEKLCPFYERYLKLWFSKAQIGRNRSGGYGAQG
jgi:hypothetical protein